MNRRLLQLVLVGVGGLLLGAVVTRLVTVQRLPLPAVSRPGSVASQFHETPREQPAPAPTLREEPPGTKHETFSEPLPLATATWQPEDLTSLARELPPDVRPYADDGPFFLTRDPFFTPPEAHRLSVPFGQEGFLTLEVYTRMPSDVSQFAAVVDDPAAPGNRVLKITSSAHTDAAILRTTRPLGAQYTICARIGSVDFGTGDDLNGYDGGERAEPWLPNSAMDENGCYFGAIYRSPPRPHNNILAHHDRVAFIDTDNNTGAWTKIWDPAMRVFIPSGWHPLVMAVADGRSNVSPENGPPFRAYSAGGWNAAGEIAAVDAYKEGTWYTACFARSGARYTLRLSGDFRMGGSTTYEAVLDDASDVFGFNDPHFWLAGDPHINYYEGSVLIDDVTLTVGP